MRGDQIHRVPAAVRFVGVNSAGHAQDAEEVLRDEGQVEPDREQPEMPFAQRFVQALPGDFREPIIHAAEEGED